MTNQQKQLQEGFDTQVAQIQHDFDVQIQDVKSSSEAIINELRQSNVKYRDTFHESMSQSVHNMGHSNMDQSATQIQINTQSIPRNKEFMKKDSYLFTENENNMHSESRMSNKSVNMDKSMSSSKNKSSIDKNIKSKLF